MYPKKMRSKNGRLFPFVVLAFHDFITLSGQDAPKLTIITISSISAIFYLLFVPMHVYLLTFYHSCALL